MSDTNGGVRAMWINGGPMVIISNLGDVTAEEFEESVKSVVNEVVARAEGQIETMPSMPPIAPPVAPVPPVVRH